MTYPSPYGLIETSRNIFPLFSSFIQLQYASDRCRRWFISSSTSTVFLSAYDSLAGITVNGEHAHASCHASVGLPMAQHEPGRTIRVPSTRIVCVNLIVSEYVRCLVQDDLLALCFDDAKSLHSGLPLTNLGPSTLLFLQSSQRLDSAGPPKDTIHSPNYSDLSSHLPRYSETFEKLVHTRVMLGLPRRDRLLYPLYCLRPVCIRVVCGRGCSRTRISAGPGPTNQSQRAKYLKHA